MKKKAYVLSGGGVLSAYQVGVLRQLSNKNEKDETDIKFFGVSGGALAAVAYSYLGSEGALNLYRTIKHRKQIFSYNIMNLMTSAALYKHKPLHKMLDRIIMNFEPDYEVEVFNTNLRTGMMHGWRNDMCTRDEFSEMATASACIPGLVQPVDDDWVDGGVIDNTPLKAAIEQGYTDITVILTDDPSKLPRIDGRLERSVVDVLLRSYELMRHDAFREDLKVCLRKNAHKEYEKISLTVYALNQDLYSALDFNHEAISFLINEGLNAKPVL